MTQADAARTLAALAGWARARIADSTDEAARDLYHATKCLQHSLHVDAEDVSYPPADPPSSEDLDAAALTLGDDLRGRDLRAVLFGFAFRLTRDALEAARVVHAPNVAPATSTVEVQP